MFADDIKRLTAEVHKVMKLRRWLVSSVNHISHVRGQDKRRAVPDESKMVNSLPNTDLT